MSRMIDADALELILNNAIEMMVTMAKALDSEDDPEIQMEIKAYTDILNGVKEQPTIEECKTGRWIYGENDVALCDGYWCDKCGFFVPWDYKHKSIDYIKDYHFCPNCGADMRGEHDDR